jgi:hypothetical protein
MLVRREAFQLRDKSLESASSLGRLVLTDKPGRVLVRQTL